MRLVNKEIEGTYVYMPLPKNDVDRQRLVDFIHNSDYYNHICAWKYIPDRFGFKRIGLYVKTKEDALILKLVCE
jgi:hypothetical protein